MGWNNNPESLIDVSNPATLTKIRNDSTFFMKKREASKGRYDGQMGIVKSFDYTMTADGGFECSTEISFQSELLLEMSTKAEKSEDKQGESNKKFVSYLKENLKAWVEGKPIQPNWFPKESIYNGVTDPSIFGFSSKIIEDKSDDIDFKPRWDDDHVWITMDFLISIINTYTTNVFENGDNSNSAPIDKFAGYVDISDSWVRATPNIKSTNGEVLLIPNSRCPAYGVKQDDLDKLDVYKEVLGVDESEFTKTADKALSDIFDGQPEGSDEYSTEYSTKRINLQNIIATKLTEAGYPASFPDYTNVGKGYAGRLGLLYINTNVIIKSFDNADSLKSALSDILAKVSAACSLWRFEVLDHPTRPSHLTIMDSGFPGFVDGSITDIGTILRKKNYNYRFNTLDNESIILNLGFSAKVPDK